MIAKAYKGDKMTEQIKTSRIIGMFMALCIAAMFLTSSMVVLAQDSTDVPTLEVGDVTSFGKIVDLNEVLQPEMTEISEDLGVMGIDSNIEINGNLGIFVSTEVVDDSTNINGDTCYDVQISGAAALDFSFDAEADGLLDGLGIYYLQGSVDATVNASITLEVAIEGHIYYTVDEMAIAREDMKLTIDGEIKFSLDYSMITEDGTFRYELDGEADISNVEIDWGVDFDPPLNLFDFPIEEGDSWSVPEWDTGTEIEATAEGTVSYEMTGTTSTPYGDDTIYESQYVDLAEEIGRQTDSSTIYDYDAIPLICTGVYDGLYIIEIDFNSLMDTGTRQQDIYDMAPEMEAGFVYNEATGLIAGATINGEIITTPTNQETVTEFSEHPLEITQDAEGMGFEAVELDYDGDGTPLLGIILIGVIVIIVVVIVVVMLTRKKAPPQQYPPQQYAQQPPPPPPEYQPQQPDQYQQPPADQYQQPPPPPPPGQ